MASIAKDRTGQRFGRLVALSREPNDTSGSIRWLCRCDCGTEKVFQISAIRSGSTASCGCLRRETLKTNNLKHGRSNKNDRTYQCYFAMLYRCYTESCIEYPRYGGRGITVCDRWRDGFENFLEDMGEKPEGLSLDRIKNDQGYSKENCRWATAEEQMNNRRNTRFVEYRGESYPIGRLARQHGISRNMLYDRIDLGWPIERALTEPKLR